MASSKESKPQEEVKLESIFGIEPDFYLGVIEQQKQQQVKNSKTPKSTYDGLNNSQSPILETKSSGRSIGMFNKNKQNDPNINYKEMKWVHIKDIMEDMIQRDSKRDPDFEDTLREKTFIDIFIISESSGWYAIWNIFISICALISTIMGMYMAGN